MQAADSILSNIGIQTITNITSYDVLADPSVQGVIGAYQLDNYKKNVGNNRLKVFLDIHQQDYERAHRQNNAMACDSIVTNILHTLNKKCVPTGRFLINAVTNTSIDTPNNNNMNMNTNMNNMNMNMNNMSMNMNNMSMSMSMNMNMNMNNMNQVGSSQAIQSPVWILMGEYEAKQLIHGILKRVPPPDLYRYMQQQKQLQQQAAAAHLNPNNSSNGNSNNGMEEHKRRRRSSLLRRSASDSLLDDSKKVSRFDQQQLGSQNRRMSKEEPIWSSSRRLTNNEIVSLNRMDVILTSTMDALDPNCQSIGNNRLHILVAMQSAKYQQGTDRQKEAILDEVMQAVNSFWKGRFLTETTSGCYEILDNEDAKRSLRHIFDMRSGQNLNSHSSAPALNITPNISSRPNNNESQAQQLMGAAGGMANHEFVRMTNAVKNNTNTATTTTTTTQFRNDPMSTMGNASMSNIPSGNNISNDTKNMLSRQMSSPLLPTPISVSSLPIMEPPIALSGINDLRSAAIKSLQKQKARQQVANRLEKVSMRISQQNLQQQQQLQQQQLQQQQQQQLQPDNINIMNGLNVNNIGNHNLSPFSMNGGGAKRRQSSIFGALDPTVMDEIVDGCFDDED